jgi:hypothetical protein
MSEGVLVPFSPVTVDQARAIAAAMRAVAAANGSPSAADDGAIAVAIAHVLNVDPHAVEVAPPPEPAALAEVLRDPALERYALQLIAVMAFVDGTLDQAKIDRVLRYADALGIGDDYVIDLAQAAQEHVAWLVADMSRRNAASIAGIDPNAAFAEQFLPYDAQPDPELAAQFRALGELATATFGRAFYEHYDRNGYAFPGDRHGFSIAFAVPHDAAHLISGYGTSSQGEMLASSFVAAMHRRDGMAGHILPVIFSRHLGAAFNGAAGGFDGEKFRRAWERGRATRIDTFGPEFDFWKLAEMPLQGVRDACSVPPLDAQHAANGEPAAVRGWPAA